MLYLVGYLYRDPTHNPPPTPPIETQYAFGREVGRGGSGIVLHAFHKKSKCNYAIKIIRNLGQNGKQSENVAKEISIMRRLRHPNICRMIEVFYEPLRTCEYGV